MSDLNVTKRERQRQRRQEKEHSIIEARARRRRKRQTIAAGILVLVLVGVGVLIYFLQKSDDSSSDVATETTTTEVTLGESTMPNYTPYTEEQYGAGECPPAEVPTPGVLDFADAPNLCLDLTKEYDAVITTSEGVIKVRLDTTNTPGTSNNFATLAMYGYYNSSLLFRTDTSIDIIQGGGPHTNSPSDPGPGYNIFDEGTGFAYEPGDLVMARSAGLDSASAQFFFAAGPKTSLLDGQGTYVTFGRTTEGLDVLENILGLHQDDPTSGLGGGPSREVVVESVEIVEVS